MPGKSPAWPPGHRTGSKIMSYHQCHYHEDHMHSSWGNMGHVLNVKVKGGAHSSSSRISWAGHLWPQGETSVSPARCLATFLCGSETEESVPRQEGGKVGGEPTLKSLDSVQSWRPTLQELKTTCSNTKGDISERARHPAKKGRN